MAELKGGGACRAKEKSIPRTRLLTVAHELSPAAEFKCGSEPRFLRRPYSFSFGRGASFRSHGRVPLESRSQARSFGPLSNSALYLARSVLIWSRKEGGASLEAGAACPWVDSGTITKAAKNAFFIKHVNQYSIAESTLVFQTRPLPAPG